MKPFGCVLSPPHSQVSTSHNSTKHFQFSLSISSLSMAIFDELKIDLTKPTSIFGFPLWVLIGFIIGSITFLIIFLLCCFIYCYCCRPHRPRRTQNSRVIPHDRPLFRNPTFVSSKDSSLIHKTLDSTSSNRGIFPPPPPPSVLDIQIDVEEDEDDEEETEHYQMVSSSRRSSSYSNTEYRRSTAEVEHLGWGHWFTRKEIEEATNGFSDNNVIGKGVYGTVYEGILLDNMKVVVKRLLDNRDQAEKDFKVEVEAIGRIIHKNLVRLLGYCVEGPHRMLVYEYVDNGNLRQWLHGNLLEDSLLTWDIRMNIILGTAKALAYLHEGLEPKVVHRDIKSCNILLDQQWNPKISDFGLAKLLCSERSYITTRVMGTYGYLAPEYACTGMLNEKSDVYSFGVLVMEIVSGRRPIDNTQPPEEENMIEWLKNKVANRRFDQILDPKLPEIPSSKALKRVLLVAIRCVDPDAQKRPKMGQVLNLLERDDLLSCDELRIGREASRCRRDYPQENQIISRLSVEKSNQ